jgi:formylglycine-generating enzyme required for sulfatase activity
MARSSLDAVRGLPPMERLDPILELAREAVAARSNRRQVDQAEDDVLTAEVVALIDTGIGSGRQRLALGQVLGMLGDPRLAMPSDPSYWVRLTLDDGRTVSVGRYLVTTQEFRAWMRMSPAHGEPEAHGGYHQNEGWSDAGRAWRDSGATSWAEVSASSDLAHLLVPNHPVVGVNWFEADAYARAKGARLLTSDERRFVLRGEENRPYPWGEPFGSDNSNTREEGLGGPCAVGLFVHDRTPEGVTDLAGNAAEWLADDVGADERLYHPGSWKQPSMASWAKALQIAPPDYRSPDLGFRLIKD